jgi:cytochrome c5
MTTTKTHRHKYSALGGCVENPGCFDLGGGDMIFVSSCQICGRVKLCGTNYAGRRRDWKKSYPSVAAYMKAEWPSTEVTK